MSKGKILVTDSLFIFDEHVKKLEDAGYEVERLGKPDATDEELIKALKGKVGYILGGIERVGDKVLESTDELKAIAFTGAGWDSLIPGWETAKKKRIVISNAPGGNAYAVAEWAVATALMMQRNLLEIGRTGDKTFATTGSLKDMSIGVIGAGKIGSKITQMLNGFELKQLNFYNRSKSSEATKYGGKYVELDHLLKESDVIFVTVPGSAGEVIGQKELSLVKNNVLIVSISPDKVVNMEDLFGAMQKGKIRAVIDWPSPSKKFDELPLSVYYNTNNHAAYNTHEALTTCSDMAVESLLNLLATGEDQYRVV